MKINELKAKRESQLKAAQALIAASDGRDMTEAEAAQWEAAMTDVETCDAEIKAHEERIRVDADRKRRLEAAGRSTPAIPPGAYTPRVTDMRLAVADDPMKGYRIPRDFVMDVIAAGTGRRVANADALRLLATAGSDEQSTFSDSYGGYLVPVGMSPQLLQMDPETDPIAGRTTQVPMATTSVKINARTDKNHTSSVSGGLRVYWRQEADTIASSRMQFEQIELTANTLMGTSYQTEEILADSPLAFAAIIAQGFQDEFTSTLIDARINGSGVGKHLGIINSPAVVSIAKETNQSADTIVYENLIKMRARVWGYQNAIWMANHDCLPQLMLLNQSVGTAGVPVWQPSAREDAPDILLGRPLILTEYCDTVGDTGDIWCVNWREYLEGIYQPLQSAESIHVRFLEHERTFKFWLRIAGAPWWRTALTPKNSTATLSPFVKLDARA